MWISTTQKSAGSQARTLVKEGAVLLDVRTREEFASGHIAGAKSIPLAELPARARELGEATRKVVVYCRSGARSAAAAQLLRQAGYDVLDIGGMHNW